MVADYASQHALQKPPNLSLEEQQGDENNVRRAG